MRVEGWDDGPLLGRMGRPNKCSGIDHRIKARPIKRLDGHELLRVLISAGRTEYDFIDMGNLSRFMLY
jgi:hypothetical protein